MGGRRAGAMSHDDPSTGITTALAAAREALERVRDPELGVSIVALGLVRALVVEQGVARVELTFTSMGCPWMESIRGDVERALLGVPGVQAVVVEEVWHHFWTARDVREDARAQLRVLGIVLP
jgi:metal-sulfur cluster biosynthetic enzyme